MIPYNQKENNSLTIKNNTILSFNSISNNIDSETVESFGDEWEKFSNFTKEEIEKIGNEYFDIIGDSILNKDTIVLDMGCGSGRWSKYVASRAKFVEAIDPSDAIYSATLLLQDQNNVRVTQASSDNIPFADKSFDFVFSLGVLHHIPNTSKALDDIVKKVKINGHVLLYLYYSLDNRGFFYKSLFHMSSIFRIIIAKLPKGIKHFICDLIAFGIYIPLITIVKVIKSLNPKSNFYKKLPLSYYLEKSVTVIRNDALDRFGTPLEQRFSKTEIKVMMESAGLIDIKFSENTPYWHAVGKRSI